MKTQILKALQLQALYKLRACNQNYADTFNTPIQTPPHIEKSLELTIKNCSLCQRIKHCNAPSIGLLHPNCTLCFITDIPLLDEKNNFIQNKSALMLQNIITNVFALSLDKVSILSLIKCDPHNPRTQKEEILSCAGFTHAQLTTINPAIHILLGDNVSEHILGARLEHSRILWHNGKKFLISYALNELVRNPSLKAGAKNDFDIAKGQL